ncbi:MAG: hypothetical protein JO345_39060 [Streptosporangiaceae bacterium]|nr:hypothetical protein [Streptosporangiaceae bacterium]
MRTPPHIVVYRSVISSITALILIASGFGLAGHGPLTALHQLASPVTHVHRYSLRPDRTGE